MFKRQCEIAFLELMKGKKEGKNYLRMSEIAVKKVLLNRRRRRIE